jgi:hypothetical protein
MEAGHEREIYGLIKFPAASCSTLLSYATELNCLRGAQRRNSVPLHVVIEWFIPEAMRARNEHQECELQHLGRE